MYKNIDDLPIILTVADLATILKISKNGAYALCNSKDFPVIQIGKRKVIPKGAFEEWLNEGPRVVNI